MCCLAPRYLHLCGFCFSHFLLAVPVVDVYATLPKHTEQSLLCCCSTADARVCVPESPQAALHVGFIAELRGRDEHLHPWRGLNVKSHLAEGC